MNRGVLLIGNLDDGQLIKAAEIVNKTLKWTESIKAGYVRTGRDVMWVEEQKITQKMLYNLSDDYISTPNTLNCHQYLYEVLKVYDFNVGSDHSNTFKKIIIDRTIRTLVPILNIIPPFLPAN